jgi:hypothetical protein
MNKSLSRTIGLCTLFFFLVSTAFLLEAVAATPSDKIVTSNTVTITLTDRDSILHSITVQMDNAPKVTNTKSKTDEKGFKNIFMDVDTEYQISDNRIKEQIILKSDKAKTNFDFTITDAGGLHYELDAGGNLIFNTYDGDYTVITCPKPYAIDATGAYYRFEFQLVGKKIKIKPVDQLKGVVYPLTIDPSYVISSLTTADSTASHRNMVRTSDNHFYVTYLKEVTGKDTVCVAYSEDLMNWEEIKQFTGMYGDSAHPSMAIDHWDILHVVWAAEYNDTRSDLYYSSYNGTGWSEVDQITDEWDYDYFRAKYPAIAVNSVDTVHITFSYEYNVSEVLSFNGVGYIGRISDDLWQNNSIWAVYSEDEILTDEIAMCVDLDNVIHVAYSVLDSGYYIIYYQNSMTNGITWNEPVIMTNDSYNHTQPSIAVDNQNQVIVAWAAYGNWTGRKIRARIYNLIEWEEPFNVSDGPCDEYWEGNPSIQPYLGFEGMSPSDVTVIWWGYSACSIDSSAIFARLRYNNNWDTYTYYPTCNGTYYGATHTARLLTTNNNTYPVALFATWPLKCDTRTNIVYSGYNPTTGAPGPLFTYTALDITKTLVYTGYYIFPPTEGFDITIYAYDLLTGEPISDFTANLDTGSSDSTTTGSIVFECEDAEMWIEVSIESPGYYVGTKNVYLDSSKTIRVPLTLISAADYYPPATQKVEFEVMDYHGRDLEGIEVTAVGIESTHNLPDWLAWIYDLEGEQQEIVNTTMSNTTDSFGRITFVMVPTIKYRMTFFNDTLCVNSTLTCYPKDDYYAVYVHAVNVSQTWLVPGEEAYLNLTITIAAIEIDDAEANISFFYDDPSGGTTNVNVTVSTDTGFGHWQTVAVWDIDDDSSFTHNFTVTDYTGKSYKLHVVAQNSYWGTKTADYAVNFKGLLQDLGLPPIIYPLLAVSILIFLGALFTATTSAQGSIIVCLVAWLFLSFRWFEMFDEVKIGAAISVATVFSIIIILNERSKKEGVA